MGRIGACRPRCSSPRRAGPYAWRCARSGRMADVDLPRRCLRAYLAPRTGSPWRWSADRSAIESRDGETIAFAAEVRDIVAWFAEHGRGLPPWDDVVVLLQRSRRDWRERHRSDRPAVPDAVLDA